MRKRDLEVLLSRIPGPPKPRLELEQYVTPPHVAARLLWIAELRYRDLSGVDVADLGAGTGRLGIGAALLGADHVILLDVDRESLEVAREYSARVGVDAAVSIACMDATMILPPRRVHCVVQNPPFGVHSAGRDVEFLDAALRLGEVVYSLHKAETIDYLRRRLEGLGCAVELLFVDEMRLPPTMPHHRKREHRVAVAAIRVSPARCPELAAGFEHECF